MSKRAQYEVPTGLKEAEERFTEWRSSHSGRRPIPEPLWALATQLARHHGIFRTAQVLRLDYTKLKRQMQPTETAAKPAPALPTAFIELVAPTSQQTCGIFTSGIVSVWKNRKIALYFTGRQHAGENLAHVLKHRAGEIRSPIQMCDALSRNTPKLTGGVQILLANCIAHGRRQFIDVAGNFPEECGFVLESLGMVYGNEALARDNEMNAEQRLQFHQQYSGPLMDQLHQWLEQQLSEARTEPNSGLGKAISYLLNHWQALTLFLREQGAPLDNNVCERALKKAILNRRNALFYKTPHGAKVGDLFMSLIHTCELNGVNSFRYLTELLRHPEEAKHAPADWMPWNYTDALGNPHSSVAA